MNVINAVYTKDQHQISIAMMGGNMGLATFIALAQLQGSKRVRVQRLTAIDLSRGNRNFSINPCKLEKNQ